jgi:hypothetical protein
MKINKSKLIEIIKEEAEAFKREIFNESEAIESSIEVYDIDMNSNDELGDSEKALTYKDTDKKVEKEGEKQPEIKMNSKDSEEGSDKDAAVATKVEASGKHGGNDHLTGKSKPKFTSKKEIQSTKPSTPFEDRKEKVEMNSEDKLVDEKAKTYVSAGEPKKGNSHTAGQHKADVHEKAPSKDVEEKEERIAKGIEIDGSNIDLKESYTKDDLKNLIISEAKKAVKNYKKTLL